MNKKVLFSLRKTESMRKIITTIILFCLCCFYVSAQQPDQHLDRVKELRALVDDRYWHSFNDERYLIPLDYREEGPFIMQMSINGGMESAKMHCSSPEITFQSISGVQTLNDWYAMLLHECFHGFQFKHPDFFEYASSIMDNPEMSQDTIVNLKLHSPWYKELLDEENALLKQAYLSDDEHEMHFMLQRFLTARDVRFSKTKELLGLDISAFYTLMETYEGTARYIEYCLSKELGITPVDWMFNLDSDTPYYASGFYLVLILDKMKLDYKSRLFDTVFLLTDFINKPI